MSPNSALRSTTDTGADFVRAQAKGRDPRRGPPMDGAIARCTCRRQIRRQCNDRTLAPGSVPAQDVAFMRLAGLRVVVVHGGGPQIKSMLSRPA